MAKHKPKGRSWVSSMSFGTVALVLTALLVLGYLSIIVPPEKAWFFTLFGLLYPLVLGKVRDGAVRLELCPVAILLLADVLWALLRRRLSRKMALAEEGRGAVPGLPHPGMIITVWLTQLCVLFVLLGSNCFADGGFARVTLILCALKLLGLTIGVGVISRLESAAPQGSF